MASTKIREYCYGEEEENAHLQPEIQKLSDNYGGLEEGEEDRLVILVYTCDCIVQVDLLDVLGWVKNNMPELL